MSRIEEIKARVAVATAGEWSFRHSTKSPSTIYVEAPGWGGKWLVAEVGGRTNDEPNAAFIAHARADIPYLIERVEALESALRCAIPYIERAYECSFPDPTLNAEVLSDALSALEASE